MEKSMIIEAMMKTLLDETDPYDMLAPNAPRHMFIESRPSEALKEYCYAAGNHEGVPVLFGFDRQHYHKNDFIEEFRGAITTARPTPMGGAVFISDFAGVGEWLEIFQNGKTFDLKSWERNSVITVRNEKLKADPRFRLRWQRLQEIVKSGDLTQLTERAYIPSNSRHSAFESFTQTLMQVLRR